MHNYNREIFTLKIIHTWKKDCVCIKEQNDEYLSYVTLKYI